MSLENPKLHWYNQPKTNTTGYKLSGKFDYITVASSPMEDGITLEIANSIKNYINVSSTPYQMNSYNESINANFHWFPISELGFMGFNTIYGFIKTMEKIDKYKQKSIIHCEAGTNRSPTMAMLWLLYKNDNNLKKAKSFTPLELDLDSKVKGNIELGLIPSLEDLNLFFNGIKKDRYLDDILFNDTDLGNKY